jgi:hypothetical protein
VAISFADAKLAGMNYFFLASAKFGVAASRAADETM